jgi:hypothetical protein
VTPVLPPLQSASKKASNPSISASSFQTLKSFFKTEISGPWEETSIPREQQQRLKAKLHGPDEEHEGATNKFLEQMLSSSLQWLKLIS